MERLYPERKFTFNDKIDNWKAVAEKAIEKMHGTLYLTDEETGENVEAEIIFLYSTLIYSGFNCRGIIKIGDEIGSAFISLTVNMQYVLYRSDDSLQDKAAYDKKIKEIVEDLDDDCRYSEAIHVNRVRGIDGMKALIRQYHAMQIRNNNPDTPYTEHLYGVSSILKTIAESEREIPGDSLDLMIQAALGHDLLEDTVITEDTVKRVTGAKVLDLIRELTNPNDDAHTDEYMKQLAAASEEARLIKYADLIENTTSFCYALHEAYDDNPVNRVKDFYLPILSRTTDVLANTSFEYYPKTADAMRMILKVYTELLLGRIETQE